MARDTTPSTLTASSATTRRSFNASTEKWRADRRGKEPNTVWGARAVEAIMAWERGEKCMAHAVAVALEEAYEEGTRKVRPRDPENVPAAQVPETVHPDECADCATDSETTTPAVRAARRAHSTTTYKDIPSSAPPRVVRPAPRTTQAASTAPAPIVRHAKPMPLLKQKAFLRAPTVAGNRPAPIIRTRK